MKKIISLVLILICVLSLSVVSFDAADYKCNIDTTSNAVILKNIDTGNIIYEKNAKEKIYPASLTKIMTYIIVAESIPDFKKASVTIKEETLKDLDPESSVMGLAEHTGESFTVEELLYGMMVASGNDAAWALADYVGPGVQNFVELMNQKAGQLGCNDTHFVNPHGLHDAQHYTTASDMAKITEYALTKKSFSEITNTKSYRPRGYKEDVKTTNFLIDKSQHNGDYYYEFAKGIKTGYTNEAGKCIISTAENGPYNYLLVAMNSPYSEAEDINYAMIDSKDLYEWTFANVKFKTIYSKKDEITRIPVRYVWGNKELILVPSKEVKALLPAKYDESKVRTEVKAESEALAPVQKGDVFGKLTVSYDGEEIASVDLVASEDINRSFTNYLIHRIASFIKKNIVVFIILVLIIIVALVLISNAKKRKKREENRRRYR